MLRGVFWVVDGELLAFPFRSGVPYGVSKAGNTYNHRLLWDHVKPRGCRKPFDYYPRGRIEITRQGVPILYMNPNIPAALLPEIMACFELPTPPVIRFDHSKHYRCHLDNGYPDEFAAAKKEVLKKEKNKAHIKELSDYLAEMPDSRPVFTGIEALDRMGVRFEPGKLYVIGGRPGMGLTSFMLDIALQALREKTPVNIFTMRESIHQLRFRIVAKYGEIPIDQLREQPTAIKAAAERFHAETDASLLFIYDKSRLDDRIAETMISPKMSGLIMIDALNPTTAAGEPFVLSGSSFDTEDNILQRQFFLGDLLQTTAQDRNTAIVVLSKIPRKTELRKNRRPKKADLNDALSASASAILFLYRKSYYLSNISCCRFEPTEIIVAKNTGGNTGTAYVSFDNERLSFI